MAWFPLLVLLALVLATFAIYNGLVRLSVRSDEAWADIDAQLKRRYDLIPNLVETVKGYAGHERQLFENVSRYRSAAMSAAGPEAKGAAENQLTQALRQLFAVAEAYPQLRANENFLHLQQTLSEVEDKIQHSRRYYNAVVRDLNTKIKVVPSNVIAQLFRFQPRQFFQAEEEERAPVRVDFGTAGGSPRA